MPSPWGSLWVLEAAPNESEADFWGGNGLKGPHPIAAWGLSGQQGEVPHHCCVVGVQLLPEGKCGSCWSRNRANRYIPGFGHQFPRGGWRMGPSGNATVTQECNDASMASAPQGVEPF